MNVVGFLPLAAFVANLALGMFILYKAPNNRLNRLYSLSAFAWALWAIGDFLVLLPGPQNIVLGLSRISTLSALLTAGLVLHFSFVFTGNRIVTKRLGFVPLYAPAAILAYIALFTNLISVRATPSWWGNAIERGVLYIPMALYIAGFIVISIIVFYRSYRRGRDRISSKYLAVSLSIPLAGGVGSQIVAPVLGVEMMPLTSTLTVVSAVVIAYTVMRFKLMSPPSFSIQRKMLTVIFMVGVMPLIITGSLFFMSSPGAETFSVHEAWFYLVGLLILSLALTSATSFLLTRWITRPIIRLRNIAEQIGKGDLEVKIPGGSLDEIGQLTSSIRIMVGKLRKSKRQERKHATKLKNVVDERTVELNKKVKELEESKIAILSMMEDVDETNRALVEVQGKLRESLQKLESIDAKKDQFISIAAHELKTPLTAIHGFSELLKKKSVAEDKKKREGYLKIMGSETRRLSELVTDILELSRIDLGTVKLVEETVSIKDIINTVKNEIEIIVRGKGLKFTCKVESRIPAVPSDREKITQVLINLLNNAVKYTEKGTISLNVSQDDGFVHFAVKDTGIGIPKKEQKKIFERFYQVDSSYTRAAGGTGLGLALCREYASLLGGRVWLESRVGTGSTFHFTLPKKGIPGKKMSEERKRAIKRLKESEHLSEKARVIGMGK
jgi:signal transduction histidine kinase